MICGAFEHLEVTQRAARVVIAGAPMFLHAQPREFIILGVAFVAFCPIDQMHDIVQLALGDGAEHPRFRTIL